MKTSNSYSHHCSHIRFLLLIVIVILFLNDSKLYSCNAESSSSNPSSSSGRNNKLPVDLVPGWFFFPNLKRQEKDNNNNNTATTTNDKNDAIDDDGDTKNDNKNTNKKKKINNRRKKNSKTDSTKNNDPISSSSSSSDNNETNDDDDDGTNKEQAATTNATNSTKTHRVSLFTKAKRRREQLKQERIEQRKNEMIQKKKQKEQEKLNKKRKKQKQSQEEDDVDGEENNTIEDENDDNNEGLNDNKHISSSNTTNANTTSSTIEDDQNTNTTTSTTTASSSDNTTTPTSDSTDQQKKEQQQLMPQRTMVFMGGHPPGGTIIGGPPPPGRGGMPSQPPPPPHGAVIAEVLAVILATGTRLWLLTWIAKRVASEEESMHPTQHFVWECINDRFVRDEVALENALSKPTSTYMFGSNGGTATSSMTKAKTRRNRRRWKKQFVEATTISTPADIDNTMITAKNENGKKINKQKQQPDVPKRTVIVLDLTPNPQELDLVYISDAITFLIQQKEKSTNDNTFGGLYPPEVVLLIQSPGGAVTSFGLAAAQILRLKKAGFDTTVCIDKIAASGGYMMASQANKIIAAPFATIGSIGVMAEGINLNSLLNTYGIQPLVLKSGDHKNPLSTFGNVTQDDLNAEQERLEAVHKAFITSCLQQRPQMIEHKSKTCNGSVLLGLEAIDVGMVDEILTSDEYIWRKVIKDNEFVLMLHKSHFNTRERRKLLSTLDLLPHLLSKHKEFFNKCMMYIQNNSNLVSMILLYMVSKNTNINNNNNNSIPSFLQRFLPVQ